MRNKLNNSASSLSIGPLHRFNFNCRNSYTYSKNNIVLAPRSTCYLLAKPFCPKYMHPKIKLIRNAAVALSS